MRISDWSSDVCSSDLSHAVLPDMLARGDGAIVVVNGLTASVTMPGMSGVGPAMAAARNYIFPLNAAVAPKGDRTSVVKGKSVSVCVDIGGGRIITKKKESRNIGQRTKTQ